MNTIKRLRCYAAIVGFAAIRLFAQKTDPATKPASDEDVLQLEKVSVTGVPPEENIMPSARPFNSVYGTDRSILDTPRNVTIFSREQLTAISISDVRDFTKLTSSSYTRTNFGAPSTPDIRSQIADTFLNGMRIGLSSNGNGLPINFNSVDSVNIVKGPATAVYGASQYVGGYADLISKRPYFDGAKGSVAVTVGSYDVFRWTMDYGAPISTKTAYRISYSGEQSKGYYYDGKKNTEALYYAITHRGRNDYELFVNGELFYADYTENFGINRPTQALIDHGLYQTGVNNNPEPGFYPGTNGFSQYVDKDGNRLGFGTNADGSDAIGVVYGTPGTQSDAQNSKWVVSGFPYVNSIALGPVVKIDRRSRLLRPGDDSLGWSLNLQAIQTFHPSKTLEVGNSTFFRYVDRNTLSSYSYSEIIDPSWSLENRTEFRITKDQHNINMGVALRYQFVEAYNDFFNEPANVWDLTKDHAFMNYFNSVNSPSPFTQVPVPGHPGRYFTPDNGDSGISKVTTISPFYQHDWRFNDQWSLLFGGRVDIMHADFHINWDLFGAPQRIADNITVGLPNYNASLNYKVTPKMTVYATYNWSENPVAATGNGGGITTGGGPKYTNANLRNKSKMEEVGMKRNFDGVKGFVSLALFQQQRDSLQQDRSVVTYKTRGVELEVNYQPSKHLYFTAGYSYLDATVNTPEFDVGNTSLTSPDDRFFSLFAKSGPYRRQGTPKNLFSTLTTYKWDNGFGLTAGLVYTSNITNNVAGTLVIPAQYTLDLTAFYATKQYEVRLAVLNATDQKNWGAPNAVYGNESIVAELPLHAELTLKYKF